MHSVKEGVLTLVFPVVRINNVCKVKCLPLEGSGEAKIRRPATVIVSDLSKVVKNAFDLFREGSKSKLGFFLDIFCSSKKCY